MKLFHFFLSVFFTQSVFAMNKCGTMVSTSECAGIDWEVNYVCALEKAKKSNRLLLLFFCSPPFTDLHCEQARMRFINQKNFLNDLKSDFIFCMIEPQTKNSKMVENSQSMHVQFLSKLLVGTSFSHVQVPSFVIINPNLQNINSGFISANLDDKTLFSLFNKHIETMINSYNLQ